MVAWKMLARRRQKTDNSTCARHHDLVLVMEATRIYTVGSHLQWLDPSPMMTERSRGKSSMRMRMVLEGGGGVSG